MITHAWLWCIVVMNLLLIHLVGFINVVRHCIVAFGKFWLWRHNTRFRIRYSKINTMSFRFLSFRFRFVRKWLVRNMVQRRVIHFMHWNYHFHLSFKVLDKGGGKARLVYDPIHLRMPCAVCNNCQGTVKVIGHVFEFHVTWNSEFQHCRQNCCRRLL